MSESKYISQYDMKEPLHMGNKDSGSGMYDWTGSKYISIYNPINNISNSDKMKSFVNGRITEVTNDIKKSSKKVNDKIIKIKLNEVTTQLNKVKKAKKVDDKSILALMRSYSLKRELKNVTK